ncbi:MAG: hypothetical protein WC435_00460 [Candidatus Paceibacterota bacterium]
MEYEHSDNRKIELERQTDECYKERGRQLSSHEEGEKIMKENEPKERIDIEKLIDEFAAKEKAENQKKEGKPLPKQAMPSNGNAQQKSQNQNKTRAETSAGKTATAKEFPHNQNIPKNNADLNIINMIIGGIGLFVLSVIGFIFVMIALKVFFGYVIFSSLVGPLMSAFGLDIMLARALAMVVTATLIVSLPATISYFLFRKGKWGKRALMIALSLVYAISCVGIFYGTRDVYFDRLTGKPIKFYIKTTDGFKFSNQEDFDTLYGTKYKPVTAEAMKEYLMWQKEGTLFIPNIVPGQYFSKETGEPIIWYAERENGKYELFSLPGYDPLTGNALKPISEQVANIVTENKDDAETISKIVETINQKKIDTDFYLHAVKNTFSVKANISLGDHWQAQIEKVIFIDPFLIIGVRVDGKSKKTGKSEVKINTNGFTDNRGELHSPFNILLTLPKQEAKRDAGYWERGFFSDSWVSNIVLEYFFIQIEQYQFTRILYVFNYIQPILIPGGTLHFADQKNGFLIEELKAMPPMNVVTVKDVQK